MDSIGAVVAALGSNRGVVIAQPNVSDQIQLGQQLEAIFIPNATRKRKAVIDRNGRFVHYTTAEAGHSIITKQELWLRNTTCMSDFSEVQHGLAALNGHPKLVPFLAFLDQSLNGIGKEARDLYAQWGDDTRFQTFIASISEHDHSEDQHGRLSMWRAFGRSAARVALVLKLPLSSPAADSLNIHLNPVAYPTFDQIGDELDEIRNNVEANLHVLKSTDRERVKTTIFYMLVLTVVCLKHVGFHAEREWRIIHAPKRRGSPLVKSSIQVIDGVPQLIYKIPLDGKQAPDLAETGIPHLVDRVIIGPSQYPWAMYEAFVEALRSVGVSDAPSRVFVSGIPIRT